MSCVHGDEYSYSLNSFRCCCSCSLPSLHKSITGSSSSNNNNSDSLTLQRQLLEQQQRRLAEQVAAQIEAEKARLPLTFLFERRLDHSYCRQKSVETITATFAKLQHRLLFHAFERWRNVNAALQLAAAKAAAFERAQRRALAFFERLASDAYVGNLRRAWRRWRDTAATLKDLERHASATKIQALYRRRRAAALLRELKQAALDREFRRGAEIQQLLRFERYGAAMKWSTLRNGFDLLRQNQSARRLQFFFRRVRVHVRVLRRLRRRRSAVTIQTPWRGRLARQELQRRRHALAIRRDRERRASIEIQRRTRGFLGRQQAIAMRRERMMRDLAARRLQRCWRRYRDRVALRERFVRRRRLLDIEYARLAELARIEAARRDEALRHQHATQIARVVRGGLGRRAARREREAQRLDRAARRLQCNWRRSRGRYALHLRFLAQRERLDARREAAARRVQVQVRVLFARRTLMVLRREAQRRLMAATAIQRIVRGRQARQRLSSAKRAAVTIQSAIRACLARQERSRRVARLVLEQQQRAAAALVLTRVARGHRARRDAAQRRDEKRRMDALVQQSAVLIQKRARGMEARRVTQLLQQAARVLDRQQQRRYAFSTQELVNTTPLLRLLTSPLALRQGEGDTDPETEAERDASRAELIARLTAQIRDAEREMQREDEAIVLLQRLYRGYRTRVQFVVLCLQRSERRELEQRMALRLTRVARGFLARRHVRRLRRSLQAEELKAAYLRERRRKDQEREWEERLRREQMALQLQRLQLLEREIRDAKRDAEVATWQRQAAQARKEELAAKLEAKRLERALRREEKGVTGDDEEDDDEDEEEEEEAEQNVWEQVMDAYGNWYFYNARTGESAWELPPQQEKKPKEKKEKEATKAKKETEKEAGKAKAKAKAKDGDKMKGEDTHKTETSTAAPPATASVPPQSDSSSSSSSLCCRCRSSAAVKRCLDCLDDSRRLYCAPCFSEEHGLLDPTGRATGKTHHNFVVLQAVAHARSLPKPTVRRTHRRWRWRRSTSARVLLLRGVRARAAGLGVSSVAAFLLRVVFPARTRVSAARVAPRDRRRQRAALPRGGVALQRVPHVAGVAPVRTVRRAVLRAVLHGAARVLLRVVVGAQQPRVHAARDRQGAARERARRVLQRV
ncbi:hypothetical protein PINS_up009745 [Pythium insidiosum]|nr:hypothetical protein PINS_up009745 [Pythium insidiosum]